MRLLLGDCIDKMRELPENSVDTIITDPPYGLNFMGKDWDYDVPEIDLWTEALRVLKPGGTALIFAGSRTQHRMACNVEDSGFILKDCMLWIYGSGFPKSTSIYKQLTKNGQCGNMIVYEKVKSYTRTNEKKTSGTTQEEHPPKYPLRFVWKTNIQVSKNTKDKQGKVLQPFVQEQNLPTKGMQLPGKIREGQPSVERWGYIQTSQRELQRCKVCSLSGKVFINGEEGWLCNGTPACDGKTYWEMLKKDRGCPSYRPQSAKQQSIKSNAIPKQYCTQEIRGYAEEWKPFGTALKPAYEPILVAMKPNEGSYSQNALKHGVSGLNIDGGRIGVADSEKESFAKEWDREQSKSAEKGGVAMNKGLMAKDLNRFRPTGRFPANLLLDEESGKIIDKDVGDNVSRFFKQVDITIEELSELPISEISRIIGRDRKTIRNKLKELGLYKEPKKYVKNNDTERVCEICGELKEIEEFAKWRSGKDYGYRHICKECQNCRWLPKTKEEKEKRKASSLAYAHNVRAKDRKENKITKEDVIELKSVGKCIYCGATNTEFQIDHIVPVAKGGKTEVINLVLACARCNRSKNDRNLEEWYKEQPFYNEEKLRTFYCAKASKSERNMGCEGLEVKESKTMSERKPDFSGDSNNTTGQNPSLSRNNHPTVKPIKLMEYLCILTKTPTGGVVLDPFAGSFTTGIACINTGRDFIGIEKEEEYFKIGKARIEYAVQKRKERLF